MKLWCLCIHPQTRNLSLFESGINFGWLMPTFIYVVNDQNYKKTVACGFGVAENMAASSPVDNTKYSVCINVACLFNMSQSFKKHDLDFCRQMTESQSDKALPEMLQIVTLVPMFEKLSVKWKTHFCWIMISPWQSYLCEKKIYMIFTPRKIRISYDVIKWKHFPRYWPFVRGIHRSPVNSLHKGQWRGTLLFSLICF